MLNINIEKKALVCLVCFFLFLRLGDSLSFYKRHTTTHLFITAGLKMLTPSGEVRI